MLEQLGKDELKELLLKFCDFLVNNKISGEIMIAGGAALIIEYDELRATTDIDAIIADESKSFRIIELAKEFANDNNIDPFWFNDEVMLVKPPISDKKPHTIFENNGLAVSVASPEYLLAMKINSFRPDSRDLFDAVFLCNILKISSPKEIHDIYFSVFQNDTGVNHRIIGIANEIERRTCIQNEI